MASDQEPDRGLAMDLTKAFSPQSPEPPTVREVEGRLVIDWPNPRPQWFAITPEVFEALIARANGDVR